MKENLIEKLIFVMLLVSFLFCSISTFRYCTDDDYRREIDDPSAHEATIFDSWILKAFE